MRCVLSVGVITTLSVLLLAGAGVQVADWSALNSWSVESVVAYIRDLGSYGVLAALAITVLTCVTIIPAEASALANGMIYGTFWGSVITWIGAMIGANIAYGLARSFGPPLLCYFSDQDQVERAKAWSNASGVRVLLFARLVPLISFLALNVAAGISQMSAMKFNITTGVGIIPALVAGVYMGASATELTFSAWIILVLIMVTLFAVMHRLVAESVRSVGDSKAQDAALDASRV